MKNMSFITSFIVLFAFPLLAFAQTPPEGKDINSTLLLNPSFQVGNIQINQNTIASGTIVGSVDILNDEDASFGNIQMQLLLLEPAPVITETNTIIADNARVIDRIIIPGSNSFSPRERKTLGFTYKSPNLPEGNYRIRIQVITSNGNEYGWDDYAIRLGSKDASFLMLSPQPVILQKKEYHPEEGVNVQPDQEITLPIIGTLSGTIPLTATPVLTTYAFDLTGSVVDTQHGDATIIAPKKDFQGKFKTKAPKQPGAYQATFAFVDSTGNRVSNLEQYRWVVEGKTGRIISGQFTSLTHSKAGITFDIVGPADRKTSVQASVLVSLLDGSNSITEETAHYPELGPDGAKTATATFDLASPLQNPGFRIILTDTVTSAELDRYEIHVPPVASNTNIKPISPIEQPVTQSPRNNIPNILLFVFLFMIAAVALLTQRKTGKSKKIKLPLLLLASATSLGIAMLRPHATQGANGIVIDDVGNAITSITINKPLHNNNPATSPLTTSNIPVSFTMKYIHCNNKQNLSLISIYNARDGGKHTLTGYFDQPILTNPVGSFLHITNPATLTWDPYASIKGNTSNGSFDRLVAQDYPNNDCRGGKNAECVRTINFIGNLSVPSTLDSTTLLWLSYTRRQVVGSGLNASARYLWLNFTRQSPQTPTPTPIVEPTNRFIPDGFQDTR